MRLDIQTLGTFNKLAHEGATAAAQSLTQLSGQTADVAVTRADLVPVDDLTREFEGQAFVGVEIETTGGIEGTAMLVFDQQSADTLSEAIMPESWGDVSPEIGKSGVSETANIMIGGFVDAWADHFGTKIALGPPTYIAGEWPAILPENLPVWDERQTAISFTSQLTSTSETIGFYIYLFPKRDSIAELVEAATAELPLSVDKLSLFNEMTKAGARRAAEKITQMTGIETDVEISRLTFVPIDAVEDYVADETRIGAVTQLQGPPGGFIAILFDTASAKQIGDALLPIAVEGDGLTEQHRAALEEIGNIMTSGFIDGWANTLDRKIQHQPPELIEESAATTIGALAADLPADQDYAFIFNSMVRTPDETINCQLFALPEATQFQALLKELSVETAAEAVADPEQFEPRAYDDLK